MRTCKLENMNGDIGEIPGQHIIEHQLIFNVLKKQCLCLHIIFTRQNCAIKTMPIRVRMFARVFLQILLSVHPLTDEMLSEVF